MAETNPALEAANGMREERHVSVYVRVVVGYRGSGSVGGEHDDDGKVDRRYGALVLGRGGRLQRLRLATPSERRRRGLTRTCDV